MSKYRKSDQLIEELDFQNRLLVAENKRLHEALSLIVADSCSLHPSSKFMAETALKALEEKALGEVSDE